ncbi:Hok/Gef family protein, partial [Escherichia coli]|uniref:Hok/Gef family protein n=1 Tax=Escherichia coli TaxID=562 RepID=UPI003CCACF3B
ERKRKRGWFSPCLSTVSPAVGAARETKKALGEFHTQPGQTEVAVFTAYESE